MRILYHHRTLGDGAEGIHVAAMVEAFRSLGHEVKVAAVIGDQTNTTTSRTRALERLVRSTPHFAYEVLELAYNVVGYRMLTRHFNGWKPDILYERYTLFNFAGLATARRKGIPLVLEVNAPLAYERATYEHLALQRLAQQCERSVCSKSNLVVVVSTPLKDYLLTQKVPASHVVVLPNGVDPEIFYPDPVAGREVRCRYGIPLEAVVVGFAGILRPWHGVELLFEAIAQMREGRDKLHMLIVGDGPSRQQLEQLATARGIQDLVTITGRVPHRDIPRYLNAFDIGVSLRAPFYASPMKVLEYMATGIAVVAPRMPNLQDLINEDQNGMLFRAEEIGNLITVLSSLLQDSQKRRRLGQRAHADILANRTWRHNAERILTMVERL